MATERQGPDAILAQTNLTGTVADIDEDPDSPDGNWLTAPGNNNNTDVRTSFGSPTGSPTVGADLQGFRVQVRKTNHSTDPTAAIELWENGSLVATVLSATAVSSTTGTVLEGTWNANLLGTGDGSLVECKVDGVVGGGNPTNRASLEVGAVEWNVDFSTAFTADLSTASFATAAQSLDVDAEYTADLATASLATTAQDLAVLGAFDVDLTVGSFATTAQDLTFLGEYVANLSTASFATVAQDITATTVLDTFQYLCQPLATSALATVPLASDCIPIVWTFTTASFATTAQSLDVEADFDVDLTLSSFSTTAQVITVLAESEVDLTTASFPTTANDITFIGEFTADLTTASFATTALDLTWALEFTANLTTASFPTTTTDIEILQFKDNIGFHRDSITPDNDSDSGGSFYNTHPGRSPGQS